MTSSQSYHIIDLRHSKELIMMTCVSVRRTRQSILPPEDGARRSTFSLSDLIGALCDGAQDAQGCEAMPDRHDIRR